MAKELSAESLAGDWVFMHIIMDGERQMTVNRKTQFIADGTVVNYDAAGSEKSRGSFKLEGGTIVYTDEKGKQNWKVISFDSDSLHVNHRGAEMFFERH
jgi:hypothetical protein